MYSLSVLCIRAVWTTTCEENEYVSLARELLVRAYPNHESLVSQHLERMESIITKRDRIYHEQFGRCRC